ncbi:MAG: hypothetical protein QOD77_1828 [Thermoplasmata archaeon]|jgi:hypothetical protein|nr:hypothetical protein [Thermoplasmata archaeon]
MLLPALALVGLGLLTMIPHEAQAQAVIDNGFVQVGVRADGALIASPVSTDGDCTVVGGVTVCTGGAGTGLVGLRHMATGYESTADGCACETWGVSYDGAVSGYARSGSAGPGSGLTPVAFSNTASTAVATVRAGDLLVTHDFHPTALTNDLYEVNVTIENTGPAHVDLRYRRAMDWDIQPTAFSEFVTIEAKSPLPTALSCSSDDGFATGNPLSGLGSILMYGPGCGSDFIDSGPSDHGAAFDFHFGVIAASEKREFRIYYGAASSEIDAYAAMAAVGAGVWTFGQCNPGSNPACDTSTGAPATFMFGFDDVDIIPVKPANIPPVAAGTYLARTACEDSRVSFDGSKSTDPDGFVRTHAWTFGDGGNATGEKVDHLYKAPGPYTVTHTVMDNNGALTTRTFTIVSAGDPDCCLNLNPVPPIDAMEFDAVGFLPIVWDFEDGPYSFDLFPLPTGATFNPATGEFGWPTAAGDAGAYTLTLLATDGGGCTVGTEVDIAVRPYPPPLPPAEDHDLDGIANAQDNCPDRVNRDQGDADRDGLGDLCDDDPGLTGPEAEAARRLRAGGARDRDRDGVADVADVCPDVADRDQKDLDGDRLGDLCDPDADGDTVRDQPAAGIPADNCLQLANADQADADGDGVGDACAADRLAAAQARSSDAEGRPAVLAAEQGGLGSGAKAFMLAFAAAGLLGLLVVLAILRRNEA